MLFYLWFRSHAKLISHAIFFWRMVLYFVIWALVKFDRAANWWFSSPSFWKHKCTTMSGDVSSFWLFFKNMLIIFWESLCGIAIVVSWVRWLCWSNPLDQKRSGDGCVAPLHGAVESGAAVRAPLVHCGPTLRNETMLCFRLGGGLRTWSRRRTHSTLPANAAVMRGLRLCAPALFTPPPPRGDPGSWFSNLDKHHDFTTYYNPSK